VRRCGSGSPRRSAHAHLLRELSATVTSCASLGERTLEDVDLSHVRLIFNGAEPISVELVEEFLERMAPYGLRRNTMFPVYGLAEASLAVTFPAPGSAHRSITVDRRELGAGAAVRFVAPTTRTPCGSCAKAGHSPHPPSGS